MKKLFLILLFVPFWGWSQTSLATYLTEYAESYSVRDSSLMYSHSLQNCGDDTFRQQIYYIGWFWAANINYWRATGSKKHVDEFLVTVYNMINKSVLVGGGYYGWPGTNTCGSTVYFPGIALWESYSWRHVTTWLRIASQSPEFLASSHGQGSALPGITYQDVFDDLLEWTETNIWDKWYADGIDNMYRSNTHMASHWMLIALNLWYLNPTNTQYQAVYEDIAFDGMPNRAGGNIRDQFEYDLTYTDSYVWSLNWNTLVSTGGTPQDTNHSSDFVSNVWEVYQAGIERGTPYEFTTTDMIGLARSVDNMTWVNNNTPIEASSRINGTGTVSTGNEGGGKLFAYWALIAVDDALKTRVTTVIDAREDFGLDIDCRHLSSIIWGLTAEQGNIVYPENYYGDVVGPGPGPFTPTGPGRKKTSTVGVSY